VDRELDADLARWSPDEPRVEFREPLRPVERFLAKLPPDAATAPAAFDCPRTDGGRGRLPGARPGRSPGTGGSGCRLRCP